MLTLEMLRTYGADVDDAMKRCLNNEAFYLRLVNQALQDPAPEQRKAAIETHDLEKAFEIAHALKGVLGNLSLTPMYTPVFEMTELLRGRTETDYSPYLSALLTKKEELAELAR